MPDIYDSFTKGNLCLLRDKLFGFAAKAASVATSPTAKGSAKLSKKSNEPHGAILTDFLFDISWL